MSDPRLGVQVPTAPVHVQMLHYSDDRMSQTFGPYAYVQVMYGVLRGILTQHPQTEEVIADLDPETGVWQCCHDRAPYTDIVIYAPAYGDYPTPEDKESCPSFM